jgi:hypothetical protein
MTEPTIPGAPDDSDLGWGDEDDDEDGVRRLLDERPPHHDR